MKSSIFRLVKTERKQIDRKAALRGSGDGARARGEWTKAAAHYADYLSIEPRDFDIWVQLGHAYKEAGAFPKALAAYEEAIKLRPTDFDLFLNVGHLMKLTGDRTAAIAAYKKSYELNPANSEAVKELANLGGDRPATDTRHRVDIPGDKKAALRDSGDKARATGAWTEAASCYSEYLSIEPRDFDIWVQLGHAYKEACSFSKALTAYQEAIKLKPTDFDVFLNLGHLMKRTGDHTAAIAAYKKSYELNPSHSDTLKELASMGGEAPGGDKATFRGSGDKARANGKWAEAASYYADYLAVEPRDFDIWVQLGHAYKEAGMLPKALAAYEEAIKLKPTDFDLFLNVGHLMKLKGDRAAAIAAYKKSYELNPSSSDALKELAVMGASLPAGNQTSTKSLDAAPRLSRVDNQPGTHLIEAADIVGLGKAGVSLAGPRQKGWHPVEEWGCWTAARRATIDFSTRLSPNTEISIYLQLLLPGNRDTADVSVKVEAGGAIRTFADLGKTPAWFVADGKTGPRGEVTIALLSDGHFQHANTADDPDLREMFVGIKALAYCESRDALSRVQILEKIVLGRVNQS